MRGCPSCGDYVWTRPWHAGVSRSHGTRPKRAITHGSRSGDAWQITRRARANLAEVSVVDDTPITVAEPRCLAMLDEVGHERRFEASIVFSLARLQVMRGDDDAAATNVARGRALADELGLLYGRVTGAETAAFVAASHGDLAAADGSPRRRPQPGLGARRPTCRRTSRGTARRGAAAHAGDEEAAAVEVDACGLGRTRRMPGWRRGSSSPGSAAVLAARAGTCGGSLAHAAERGGRDRRARRVARLAGTRACPVGRGVQLLRPRSGHQGRGSCHRPVRAQGCDPSGRQPPLAAVVRMTVPRHPRRDRRMMAAISRRPFAAVGLPAARPVVILLGGADGLDPDTGAGRVAGLRGMPVAVGAGNRRGDRGRRHRFGSDAHDRPGAGRGRARLPARRRLGGGNDRTSRRTWAHRAQRPEPFAPPDRAGRALGDESAWLRSVSPGHRRAVRAWWRY